jgi:hypothetical protein
MAVKPCSACGEKFTGKATSVYSAWMDGQGREAYRSSLCMICVRSHIAELVKKSISRGFKDGCDECGATGKDDYSPLWLNVYLPKREQEAFELMFCSQDVQLARSRLAHMGTKLPNRESVSSRGLENEQIEAGSVPW